MMHYTFKFNLKGLTSILFKLTLMLTQKLNKCNVQQMYDFIF